MSRSRSDLAPVHPDLRRIARLLPRASFTRRTYPVVRAATRLMARRLPDGVQAHDLGGDVTVRLHRPRAPRGDRAALLWIHGGGYVIGSAAQDDGLCRRLADRVGVTVAAVDYRLAPEHPYPAALDDCRSAYAWLAGRPDVDHERVVVAGASAGGGLAAALTIRLRDEGWPPLFQHLVYPMLDHRAVDHRTGSTDGHRMWNADVNRLGWDSYLGSADPSVAVPACVDDLSGLPRTWIGVGTLDPLLEEDREYARRLTASGVPCELHVIDGAFHGFDAIAPKAGISRTFFREQCDVLGRALETHTF